MRKILLSAIVTVAFTATAMAQTPSPSIMADEPASKPGFTFSCPADTNDCFLHLDFTRAEALKVFSELKLGKRSQETATASTPLGNGGPAIYAGPTNLEGTGPAAAWSHQGYQLSGTAPGSIPDWPRLKSPEPSVPSPLTTTRGNVTEAYPALTSSTYCHFNTMEWAVMRAYTATDGFNHETLMDLVDDAYQNLCYNQKYAEAMAAFNTLEPEFWRNQKYNPQAKQAARALQGIREIAKLVYNPGSAN